MSLRNFIPIKEGNNIIFYLNTGSFPLTSDVWNQMWNYAKQLQPSASEKMENLQNNKEKLPMIEPPTPPYTYLTNKTLSNSDKIDKIRDYIDKLQYNHTGMQFFEIRKDRPLMGLAELSKKMIEDSLPIKCLEAVILSIYFINEMIPLNNASGLEKFTIGFKTNSKGNVHRHVVLGVYCHSSGLFGALGMSRRSDLGSKNLEYNSLADLIKEYINCYSSYLHKVKRIKIGMPIPNSNRSFETIPWNGCTINFKDTKDWSKLVEKHSRSIRHFNSMYNSNKQGTILNFKNTKFSNMPTMKSTSYLNKHLNKVKYNSSKIEVEKTDICYEEDFDDDEEFSETDFKSSSLSKLNLNVSNESITVISNIRKSTAINKNMPSVYGAYSASLLKRKQSSLKV